MTADFEVNDRVEWHTPTEKHGVAGPILSAVILQISARRVYIRATLPNGRWAFRWVSARELRGVADASR